MKIGVFIFCVRDFISIFLNSLCAVTRIMASEFSTVSNKESLTICEKQFFDL